MTTTPLHCLTPADLCAGRRRAWLALITALLITDCSFTTSFGCPTFLNFGKNYAGARDDFVYVYSQDADTAYQRADRFVLARVPTDKLCDRAAYEFFVKTDGGGQPAWSKDIEQRGAVFANAGACYRSGITTTPASSGISGARSALETTHASPAALPSTTPPSHGARGQPPFTPISGTLGPERQRACRPNR